MKALNRDIDLCERLGVPLKLEFGWMGVRATPITGAGKETPTTPLSRLKNKDRVQRHRVQRRILQRLRNKNLSIRNG